MKIFIFESVGKCSDNYHTEGGVVVIAKDKRAAKKLLKKDPAIDIEEHEWDDVKSYELANEEKERIWVMPDAGCC
jgi:hypothetical protein